MCFIFLYVVDEACEFVVILKVHFINRLKKITTGNFFKADEEKLQ